MNRTDAIVKAAKCAQTAERTVGSQGRISWSLLALAWNEIARTMQNDRAYQVEEGRNVSG